jgi:hypothetical protein
MGAGAKMQLTSPATRRALRVHFACQDAQAQAEAQLREEIAAGFAQLSKRRAASIAVPALVRAHGRTFKEGSQSIAEVIADRLEGGYVGAEILQVLEHSTCPHVQQLRDALAKSWAKSWAGDIAPYRAGL